jgi:protein O-mannosyl-transferase
MYCECLPSAILNHVPLADRNLEGPSALTEFLNKTGVMEVPVCAVTVLAYLGTLSFGFVYDDKPVIVDNVAIHSWRFLAHYFIPQISARIAPPSSGTFYRPIVLLWLRVNYAIFGLHPAGWHFAMLALHVLATYLVFAAVGKLTGSRGTAALAAIFFGLHPVHVENVAWLSSVNDLLMTVFLLASFLAYLDYRSGGKTIWMATSVLWFGLALLSKETAAVFPLLIFAFAVLFAPARATENSYLTSLKDWSVSKLSAWKDGLISVPYFAVLAAYMAARRMMLHGLAQPLAPLGWATMVLTWPSILWFDLKHLLLPISSSEFYSLAYVTAPGFENFLLPIIFLLVALAVVAYLITKLPDPRVGVFALGWAIVTILPTLYLRAIAPDNFVHDRFLYLPSVGIVILAALALEQVSASKALQRAMVAILCTAAFIGTLVHQVQWASNILLYQNAMMYAPQNPIVQVNLANELANLGRYDRAVPLYLSALQRDPRLWLSNYNLGYAYYRLGRFSEAEGYLKRAIQIDGQDPDQFIYLARAQMEQGELTEAAQNAQRALQRAPLSPGFHFVLGKILESSGNRAGAIVEYEAEVASHPENALARSELQRLQSLQEGTEAASRSAK